MSDQERPEEEQERPRPRVVDKRISARSSAEAEGERREAPGHVPRDPEPEPTPTPPPEAGEGQGPQAGEGQVWTPEQEEEARRMAEEIARTSSLDWVVNAAVTLANVAGTKLQMGSVEDARLAIDSLAGIVEKAGPGLRDAEAPLRQTLAQLQMMYAERMAAPPSGPSS